MIEKIKWVLITCDTCGKKLKTYYNEYELTAQNQRQRRLPNIAEADLGWKEKISLIEAYLNPYIVKHYCETCEIPEEK